MMTENHGEHMGIHPIELKANPRSTPQTMPLKNLIVVT